MPSAAIKDTLGATLKKSFAGGGSAGGGTLELVGEHGGYVAS
ncbi:hypothetical protein [Undibacterium sp. Xuan67W]